jgi:hypothetical protein
MRMNRVDNAIQYDSQRWSILGAPAAFSATYRGTGAAYTPAPDSLDHFLTERYCLYSSDGKRIWRGDIVHPRWSLQAGHAQIDTNSMLAAAGVRAIGDDPLLHFSSFQDVAVLVARAGALIDGWASVLLMTRAGGSEWQTTIRTTIRTAIRTRVKATRIRAATSQRVRAARTRHPTARRSPTRATALPARIRARIWKTRTRWTRIATTTIGPTAERIAGDP